MKTCEPNFPYLYIGHGTACARKNMECFVYFKDIVPPDCQKKIEKICPTPLASYFAWEENILHVGSDDGLLKHIISSYKGVGTPYLGGAGKEVIPSSEQWQVFNEDIDCWVKEAHQLVPLVFVYKPIDIETGTKTDDWHDWSLEQIPAVVLAIKFPKKFLWMVKQIYKLWRTYLANLPIENQEKILKKLTSKERCAFKAFGMHLLWKDEDLKMLRGNAEFKALVCK
ncbi:MAG: hypothetical protein V1872_11885 [bacterium]